MLVFFIKLGISSQIFGLISSFLSYKWLLVVLNGKSSQEYPVNTGVLKGFILGPALSLLHINDLIVILLFILMILLFTLNVIRDLICGNKEELAPELESDLQDTVDWTKHE